MLAKKTTYFIIVNFNISVQGFPAFFILCIGKKLCGKDNKHQQIYNCYAVNKPQVWQKRHNNICDSHTYYNPAAHSADCCAVGGGVFPVGYVCNVCQQLKMGIDINHADKN